ncbi:ORF6C domain-containing protein [Paenibacillus uliginis]|uniref:ORF6C domain-containing protein n=1 Tax=Paenibacillus uliginis TaxID=683737 RepID=UPI001AD81F5C|nr:ORF6C domain-containing protein [Paenibacillus uliginis]
MQAKFLTSVEVQSLQERLSLYEKQIEALKKRVICTRKDQEALRVRGRARMIELLGDPDSENFKANKRRGFSMLWSEYRQWFKPIRSYRDTLEKDYDAGIKFIEEWIPSVQQAISLSCCPLCQQQPGMTEIDDLKLCRSCAKIINEGR